MTFEDYRFLLRSDLYRYGGATGPKHFFQALLFNPGFTYTFWLRTCTYLSKKGRACFIPFLVSRLILRHYTYKFGIAIPFGTSIGPGFYVGHFGGIVVNVQTVIGRNCNISQGVTCGKSNRGPLKGNPTIGNNVYIGPGAIVIGNIKLGDNCAVGANAVVTKDVPANSVVAGAPARVVSSNGSEGYVNWTDYE